MKRNGHASNTAADASNDERRASRLMALFAGNQSAHGTHGTPVKKGQKWDINATAKTLQRPVTVALWQAHLAGESPLGVIPIREDATCCWAAIDVDSYDEDLLDVVARAQTAKLPLVACRSKSGGLHLWLFLEQPQPAAAVLTTLKSMAATLGWPNAEIFPKQVHLDSGGTGNWIVMPYFGSTFGGKLRQQVGVKKTGAEMTLEEFLTVADHSRVTPAQFGLLNKATGKGGDDFSDGPPCIEQMAATGVEEGGRNNALFHLGVYARKKRPQDWERRLEEFNYRMMQPPLASDDLIQLRKSLRRKDYGYKCNDQPMCALCDRAKCLTRKYGVGDGGKKYPVLRTWRKLKSDEPIWFITIEGSDKEIEINNIADITNYRKFADQCAKQLNRFFSAMKQDKWEEMLQEKQNDLVEEEPPPENTPAGHFHELLHDFLTDRARADAREDLLMGRPWQDESGRHYFRMRDLYAFVIREGMRNVTRATCGKWIKKLGGSNEPSPTTIKGTSVRLWWVPSDVVGGRPDDPRVPPI